MRFLVLSLVGIFTSGAWAATESNSISLPESSTSSMGSPAPAESTTYDNKFKQVIGDKKFEEDKKVTDLELRANAGSLNRYSLQFFLGYNGAPINNLSDPNRPNPSNLNGDYRTYASGSGSLRYRANSNTGVNFGTGMSFFEPYQAVSGQEQTRPRPDSKNYGINNPNVSVDRTYTAGPTQFRSSVSVAEITDAGYKAAGEWASANFTQYIKYTPFQSRFILGFRTGLDYFAYARGYMTAKQDPLKKGDGKAAKDNLNLIPSVEYKLTDPVNFNTSLGLSYYHLRSDNTWTHPLSTWRVGVGWAITHDIYVNPYINFYAETPAMDTTNFAMNTTFSIF